MNWEFQKTISDSEHDMVSFIYANDSSEIMMTALGNVPLGHSIGSVTGSESTTNTVAFHSCINKLLSGTKYYSRYQIHALLLRSVLH
jgi:hypothetical protein